MQTTKPDCLTCGGSRVQLATAYGSFYSERTVPCEDCCGDEPTAACFRCGAPDTVVLASGKPACDSCRVEIRHAAHVARQSVARAS